MALNPGETANGFDVVVVVVVLVVETVLYTMGLTFGNLSGSPGCLGITFCSRWKP